MTELTSSLTLAETIAAGGRLLAATRIERPAEPAEPVVLAEPVALAEPDVPDVPPQADVDEGSAVSSDEDIWRSADEIAAMARCDPWTVMEHLHGGGLHGHLEDGDWWVRESVADAFLEGRDFAAQRRTCGCRPLRLVHGSRRDRRSCASVDGPASWAARTPVPAGSLGS